MRDTRTNYVIKNSAYSIASQIVNIIVKFVLRIVFVRILGQEYLGVNSVFTNILTVLSLAELGIGTAIVYDLYKPIAKGNEQEITGYVSIFKKIYVIIGSIILVAGILLIPFLKYIITDVPNVNNLTLIYLLFLIDSVLTYFFAHYRSLLSAYQLNYVNTINTVFFNVLKTISQLIILVIYKNFIFYLILQIIFNICSNYAIARKTKKMFPFIKNNTVEKVPRKKVIEIFKNSLSLFSLKVSAIVLNSTDNIIISSYISTVLAGIYSNYYLIVTTIQQSIFLLVNSLQASLGNLCAIETKDKCKKVFFNLLFCYSWIYCSSGIVLMAVMSDVVAILFGGENTLSQILVFIVVVNFYMAGVRQAVSGFYSANGLFRYFKISPWIEVFLNLVVSIVLVKIIGIEGVFVGTLISQVLTKFWYEPYILFKYAFETSLKEYFYKYCLYGTIFILNMVGTFLLNMVIKDTNIMNIALKLLIALIIPNCMLILCFRKTQEFEYIKNLVLSILNKMKIFKVKKEKNING